MTSSLTSLAILKVNWDRRGKDYIDNFVPFIVECARTQSETIITLPEIQSQVLRNFSLRLPQNALKLIIRRAVKYGYFRRENKAVFKIQKKCDDLDFDQIRSDVEKTFNDVIDQLIDYTKKTHQKSWEQEYAEEALAAFFGESSLGLVFDLVEVGRKYGGQSSGDRYIVGTFVDHARETNPPLLENLVLLARGSLLANAMYLPDPGRIGKRFRKTAVYLDTSIVAFATGLAGPARQSAPIELLDLLTTQGATLRCFLSTRNELQGIIDACVARLNSGSLKGAYGPTIEYFLESGKSGSDLELMSAQLPKKLRSLGIAVVDRPSYEDYRYQVDEAGFDARLSEAIGYGNPNARKHDVDCVSAIARIRQGRVVRDIEECRGIFVTTNSQLAFEARRFFQADFPEGAVALAITDYALANLLWLKSPVTAPDLPRKRLLADVYAAMRPSENLWAAYLTEITKLEETQTVSTDDYYILRYSLSSKRVLMDLTDGDEEAFTEGTALEVLDVLKNNMVAPVLERAMRAENAQRSVEEEIADVRRRIIRISTRLARMSRWVFFALSLPVVAWGLVVPWPTELLTFGEISGDYVKMGIGALALLLMAGNLVVGTSLNRVADWLEGAISSSCIQFLYRFLSVRNNGKH